MDLDASRDGEYSAIHAGRLDQTLAELRQMVKEHEIALRELRAEPVTSRPSASAAAPFEVMKVAYEDLATKTPYLPFSESVLPALIALRKTHQTVEETNAFLATHGQTVDKARRRLDIEQANLKDQQVLSQSLQARIQSLRDGIENRMDMDAHDIAKERMNELKQKKRAYDRDTSHLLKVLRTFIDRRLAPMLAAEDLGGPVAGALMDINSQDLEAGFSSGGRLKKAKENADQDRRQRRIDEIWGEKQEAQAADREEPRDEAASAAREMTALTEELLNSLVESDGDSTMAYVQLGKDSAAARFLVRSKVAQFHPRDSNRLRLIDFGKDLDE